MENPQKFCRKFKDVSLEELRKKVAEFAKVIKELGPIPQPQKSPLSFGKLQLLINLNAYRVGEVGELSEIFQRKGEVERGLPNWSSEDKKHLEEEISDVFLYLVQLADACGLDLGQAALSKILKNAQKYPLIK